MKRKMMAQVLVFLLMAGVVGCERRSGATKAQPSPATMVRPSPAGEAVDAVAGQQDARTKLLARINRNGDINNPSTPSPLVTLEEFFEGNDDLGSIGYNMYPDQPRPAEFYALFKQIRDRPDVADVRVQVMDLEDPAGWPSTDTVWIMTSTSIEDVKSWLGDRFRADDFFDGFPTHILIEPYDVPEGMKAIGIWWD